MCFLVGEGIPWRKALGALRNRTLLKLTSDSSSSTSEWGWG